ncbi:efflux RND transporter periplasmic adaptor subunit [Thermovibrio sp.]
MNSKRAVLLLVILVAVGVIGGKLLIEKKRRELLSYPTPKRYPLPVEWAKVREGELKEKLQYFGKVVPYQYAQISTKVSGTVLKVFKKEGEEFKRGELLAEIDSSQIENTILALQEEERGKSSLIPALKAQLKAAKVAEENAKREYEREIFLFKRKAVPKEAVEKAQNAYEAAKAKVESLKAQISELENGIKSIRAKEKALESSLKYAQIRAVKDGVVEKVYAYPGSIAVPSRPLMEVFYPKDGLRVLVELPPKEAEEVPLKETVKVEGKPIGILEKVYPSASKEGLLVLEVKLKEPIKPNRLVEVELETKGQKGTLVPLYSILHLKGGSFVLVIEGNSVKPVKVKVLKSSQNWVLVSGNLKPGQKVVVGRESSLLKAYRVKKVVAAEEFNG